MALTDPPPAKRRRGGMPFAVDQLLAEMPDDVRDGALRWLHAVEGASDRDVADVFTSDGYPISGGAVRNWRLAHGIRKLRGTH